MFSRAQGALQDQLLGLLCGVGVGVVVTFFSFFLSFLMFGFDLQQYFANSAVPFWYLSLRFLYSSTACIQFSSLCTWARWKTAFQHRSYLQIKASPSPHPDGLNSTAHMKLLRTSSKKSENCKCCTMRNPWICLLLNVDSARVYPDKATLRCLYADKEAQDKAEI